MTEQDKELIRRNVERIRNEMLEACRVSGRDPKEVKLCAASKVRDVETVSYASTLPIDVFGENRVQEFVQKRDAGAYGKTPYHFIGHLQTNKVKQVVGKVDLIQSVDRLELLECIEKQAAKLNLVQQILLEVNIGQEESKSGFTPAETMKICEQMSEYPHVSLQGLMAIPPISAEPGDNSKYFAQMHQLLVDIRTKKYDNVNMVSLSMGMSNDFEDAIKEGSTMVRVGTAIFGARNYNK